MSVFIPKETIRRLIHDIKQITQCPLHDQGIYYKHDETDILKGYAMIVGPSDTPYFGGFYFFEFTFPTNYPYSPPTVKYHTNGNNIRFNPNLYSDGKVCISLLNTWRGDQWTSCQSISTVLLTLVTLLCKNPLLNEPHVSIEHVDVNKYTHIVEYSNINIAICDILHKKQGVYQPFFDLFYPIAKDIFQTNYDDILLFIDKQLTVFIQPVCISTSYFNMNILIDYHRLREKWIDTKSKL